eukprot:UN31020
MSLLPLRILSSQYFLHVETLKFCFVVHPGNYTRLFHYEPQINPCFIKPTNEKYETLKFRLFLFKTSS